MALRELVTILRYQLHDGELKKYMQATELVRKKAGEVAREINKAAEIAAGRLNNGLRQAARQTTSVQRGARSIAEGLQRMTQNARNFGRALADGARQGARDALRELDRVNAKARQGTGRGGGGGSGGGASLSGVVNTVVGLVSGKAFMDASDSWAGTRARLGLATDDDAMRDRSERFLFNSSQASGQDYSSFAETYLAFARSRDAMGMKNDDTLVLTDLVGKLMTIGNTSAQAQSAALLQFGQAMDLGVLRGAELTSVMSQAPRLAKAIADALGVSVGQLRELGEQGKITSKAIAVGILRQGEEIDEQFAQMPMTFGRAFTNIRDTFQRVSGQWNEQYRLAERFNEVAQVVIQHLDKIVASIAAIAGAYLASSALEMLGTVLTKTFAGVVKALVVVARVGARVVGVIRWVTMSISAMGLVGSAVVAALVAAVVAGALFIRKHWQRISTFIAAAWAGVANVVAPAFRELKSSLAPLVPMWHEFATAVAGVWAEFVRFFDPVALTAEELKLVAKWGFIAGQILATAFSNAVRMTALFFRVLGSVLGAISDISARFKDFAGSAAVRGVISLLPGTGAMPGSWLDVSAGQLLSAGGRSNVSQTVTNHQTASVTVTAPPGSNPAAYGAAAQRGTKRAMGGMTYALPTPVEEL